MILEIDTDGTPAEREAASVYFDLLTDNQLREASLAKLGRLCKCGARTITNCANCEVPLCSNCLCSDGEDDLCSVCRTAFDPGWSSISGLVRRN